MEQPSTKRKITPSFWFWRKAIQFSFDGNPRPKGLRQWATCFWNADIFWGPVPFLKSLAIIYAVIVVAVTALTNAALAYLS